MKGRLTLFLVIVLLAYACNRNNYTTEINQIDSLIVELDSAKEIYSSIDTAGFSELSQSFSENTAFVQQVYKQRDDTMPGNVAMLMSEYRELKKPAKGFLVKHSSIGEELNFTQKQLEDLRHDLENNLLDANFVDRMLTDEMKALNEVESSVATLKLSGQFTKEKQAEMEPKVDSLIQVLKNQKP
ncbi:MAG: hypothetical protein MK086_08570 [Flavobacteriales bacterium]|nr:hypothetical protein [Flavobacteriales bacterium]